MDKLKKLLCCLWSTPTAILIATILYLYADRNEYTFINEKYFNRAGSFVLVTNKWTGKTCLATTSYDALFFIEQRLDSILPCEDGVVKGFVKINLP